MEYWQHGAMMSGSSCSRCGRLHTPPLDLHFVWRGAEGAGGGRVRTEPAPTLAPVHIDPVCV